MELITDNDKIEITKDNFDKILKNIETIIQSKTPVLIEEFELNDVGGFSSPLPHVTSTLFYADKFICNPKDNSENKNKFTMSPGKRNTCYSTIRHKDESHYVVKNINEILTNIKIEIPSTWLGTAYNEGTFSRAGGTSWTTRHGSGTNKIIIGQKALDKFPNATDTLNFAQDAIHFRLPRAYTRHFNRIMKKGDQRIYSLDLTKIRDELNKIPKDITTEYLRLRKNELIDLFALPESHPESRRRRESIEMTCINAVLTLMDEPMYKQNKFHTDLEAIEVKCYKNIVEVYKSKNCPINNNDYLIKEIMHPNRTLAIVKANSGIAVGEMYILPFNNTDKLLEEAFSKEHIAKYYPKD
jgi:hypothetical protein